MSRASRRRRARKRRRLRRYVPLSCKLLQIYAERSDFYFQQVYIPFYEQALAEAHRAAGVTG